MTIERKIRIDNRDFFLGVQLKYIKNKILIQKNGNNFDMGDLSIMIEDVETNYKKESKELIYDKDISYMNDIIYLYDRFPFVSYIKDITYNNDGKISYLGCINRDEIINYIKKHKIKINRWDRSNYRCPLLYQKRKNTQKLLYVLLCILGGCIIGFFANQLNQWYGCVLFGLGVALMVYSTINLSK